MVPFNLEIELENLPCEVLIEQLDRLADADGFIRFDVTAGDRRAVVYVNVENDLPLVTPQDAEAYFEAVNYPEQVSAFSEEEVFVPDEVMLIGRTIRNYNRELKVRFDRFMLRP
jgi:hypothetical protein